MKKLLSILLLFSILLTFVACNKEAEQTTETTPSPSSPDNIFDIYGSPWYLIENYQDFLEREIVEENYIPYTQLPYSEGVVQVAAWKDSEGWVYSYTYDTGVTLRIFSQKRDFDLSEENGKLLLKPMYPDEPSVSHYFDENTNGIYVENGVAYCFRSGKMIEMFWKSESNDYSFALIHTNGSKSIVSASILQPMKFDGYSDARILDPFLYLNLGLKENPIEVFDDFLFGTPQPES